MKSKITFVESHGTAYLSFNNGVAEMHHDWFTGTFAQMFRSSSVEERKSKCRAAALAAAKKLQPSVEEALVLTAPDGFVFAGIDMNTQRGEVRSGFRSPRRMSIEEKKTDSRIGHPSRLLFRLSCGLDATFIPANSEWIVASGCAPRGAGARVTQPSQMASPFRRVTAASRDQSRSD